MDKMEFKIGDKVIHKSNSSVIWIIERFEENEAYCSTILKDTKEQKKEKFALTSIEKYSPPQVRFGTVGRTNRW
ncbi:MAG: hypothetical protein WAO52_06665 [Prolixibacteraceae bacterium]